MANVITIPQQSTVISLRHERKNEGAYFMSDCFKKSAKTAKEQMKQINQSYDLQSTEVTKHYTYTHSAFTETIRQQ